MIICHCIACWSRFPLSCKAFERTLSVTILQCFNSILFQLIWFSSGIFREIQASFERYGNHYLNASLSYRHHAHKKPASRCNLFPPVCKDCFALVKSDRRYLFRLLCKWFSANGEYLLRFHGEIHYRSCLPGNASTILWYPNLKIPAPNDQPCTLHFLFDGSLCWDNII